MTPFGLKMRHLRKEKGVTQAVMAKALHVSPAYLSALENGKRGKPSWAMVQDIIQYFEVIWDDAEEIESLAKVSHPRVVVDTRNLSPKATELANHISYHINTFSEKKIEEIIKVIKA